jgi:hypothetical protein
VMEIAFHPHPRCLGSFFTAGCFPGCYAHSHWTLGEEPKSYQGT